MTATILTAIAGIITTLGGLFAWWIKRRDTQRDPIPRTAAELGLAREALGIIQESRDVLSNDIARLRADSDIDRGRIDALGSEVEELRGEVRSLRAIRELWSDWFKDLSTGWSYHRQQPKPPPPPNVND